MAHTAHTGTAASLSQGLPTQDSAADVVRRPLSELHPVAELEAAAARNDAGSLAAWAAGAASSLADGGARLDAPAMAALIRQTAALHRSGDIASAEALLRGLREQPAFIAELTAKAMEAGASCERAAALIELAAAHAYRGDLTGGEISRLGAVARDPELQEQLRAYIGAEPLEAVCRPDRAERLAGAFALLNPFDGENRKLIGSELRALKEQVDALPAASAQLCAVIGIAAARTLPIHNDVRADELIEFRDALPWQEARRAIAQVMRCGADLVREEQAYWPDLPGIAAGIPFTLVNDTMLHGPAVPKSLQGKSLA